MRPSVYLQNLKKASFFKNARTAEIEKNQNLKLKKWIFIKFYVLIILGIKMVFGPLKKKNALFGQF
jgi:hypothetical protein